MRRMQSHGDRFRGLLVGVVLVAISVATAYADPPQIVAVDVEPGPSGLTLSHYDGAGNLIQVEVVGEFSSFAESIKVSDPNQFGFSVTKQFTPTGKTTTYQGEKTCLIVNTDNSQPMPLVELPGGPSGVSDLTVTPSAGGCGGCTTYEGTKASLIDFDCSVLCVGCSCTHCTITPCPPPPPSPIGLPPCTVDQQIEQEATGVIICDPNHMDEDKADGTIIFQQLNLH